MKVKINNQIFFKSDFPDIKVANENLACHIIDSINSKKNEVILTDENLNRVSSYEIVSRIKKVAKGFNLLNLQKGDIIGAILPNMIEFSYGVLGGLLSGGVVSLINPGSTKDEINNTLSKVKPKYILIDIENYNRIKEFLKDLFQYCEVVIVLNDIYNKPILDLKLPQNYCGSFKVIDFKDFIENDGDYNKQSSIVRSNEDIAFILFSSGTTGNFKALCLTHRNILSNVKQTILAEKELNPKNSVILCCLPFFHCFGLVVVLLSSLSYGAGFTFLKKYNVLKFLKLVQNEKITFSYIVPPIAVDLSNSPLVKEYDCSSLTVLFSGAAPFPGELEDILKKRIGVSRSKNDEGTQRLIIKQGYGLTETSPVVSISNSISNKKGSSGFLVGSMQAKITCIETNKNLDSNQIGELCVTGPNVMKGYFGNTSLNDTFDSSGYFKTGDIGYFDDEGQLFIVDRKKELIKSYGYQVAPAELESILLGHPKIADVAVIAVPSSKGGEVPKAFVVLKENAAVSGVEICKWFEPKVSYYKYLRGGIVFIDKIPKSPTGKILRKRLGEFSLINKL
ncbi:hypothetical protein DICPUDRAFT_88289 [Dictyostelium purpureum]|uniref:Uncharacterized protein n=1 Tax=Dictyostelium purpureum TaxID=5786 RepID=F0ZNG6_DICPU|nr:uncharacterized protein DICPUDRAFT_88289 [Dictyostelium purpureum]EGC34528.1 hypothetical protein DICPUDRAFT_88289 [Dictyostelium purpureum]|eukprot:XP_003288964.1 hypothetical protein DICPUDRAFT_88289 [Dictyostelium purpureum]